MKRARRGSTTIWPAKSRGLVRDWHLPSSNPGAWFMRPATDWSISATNGRSRRTRYFISPVARSNSPGWASSCLPRRASFISTIRSGSTLRRLPGAVIERTSGESYRDFFQRRVFDPLGMKDTFSVPDRRVSDSRCAIGYGLDDEGGFVEQGGSEFDGLVGSGSFYTTVGDSCLYDRTLNTNSLVGAASVREAFTSGRTNDGTNTNYGFGWSFGRCQGMPFADHEGAWIGFRSYVCR